MNRVEDFEASDICSLRKAINNWCKSQNIEPISVSIAYNDWTWYAAVVVREENKDESKT